jgi:hypothetical protein
MYRALVAFSLCLCLSGCLTSHRFWNGEYYRVDGFMKDGRTADHEPVNLEALCFPEDRAQDGKCNETAYRRAASDAETRNRLQAYLMAASDNACTIHSSSMLNMSTNVNLLTGLSALALGASAPLIKPVTTKNIFAAGAALATGSRSTFNDEVYKQMLVTSILKAVRDSRESQAIVIRGKRDKTTKEYSVDEAIGDVLEYHDRCSFYRGLTDLSEAIEKKATCSSIGARRGGLLRDLAAASNDDAKKSYRQELDLINRQIAECH